jgi:hypothetical protein
MIDATLDAVMQAVRKTLRPWRHTECQAVLALGGERVCLYGASRYATPWPRGRNKPRLISRDEWGHHSYQLVEPENQVIFISIMRSMFVGNAKVIMKKWLAYKRRDHLRSRTYPIRSTDDKNTNDKNTSFIIGLRRLDFYYMTGFMPSTTISTGSNCA